jgi:UDP-2-acetamido-3-amino-2,3-dideoxy-glucuronate N-acetyltransferase
VNEAPYRLIADVEFGENVVVHSFANLYGCRIGDDTRVGTFVEIQRGATIGKRCKIQSHAFICDGIVIEDEVFIGHGVMFINDRYPQAATESGELKSPGDWELEGSTVERSAAIGSGAVIMAGVRIGAEAMVGAGAVVTHDVPPRAVVTGNPARLHVSGRRRTEESHDG